MTAHPVLVEIEAWDRDRPRSQQVEIGASGLYGCRAAAVLRLNSVPATDGRLRWDALVGVAIHAVAEQAAPDGVLVEQRFTYNGVTATIDRYDPRTKTLTDVKTKEDDTEVAKVARYGPDDDHIAQVMLGAAALQEAGHDVEWVELLYLPRVGDPTKAHVWSAVPDRQIADDAAQWAHDVTAEAARRRELSAAEQADGLQDEPHSFCRVYCEYVTACRGPEVPVSVEDPLLVEAAREYVDADDQEKAAAARKSVARRFLVNFDELPGLRWQGGALKTSQEVDLDRVLADYREMFGEPPVRTVEKTTPRSLRRTS